MGTSTRLSGIDVSNYQPWIDWAQVAASGITWAAAKATEGLGFRDPTFPSNWAGMKAHGITRLSYHFLRPSQNGDAQASFHHRVVRQSGRFQAGDGIMLDVEETDGMSAATIVNAVEEFVTTARRECGRNVVIYTGAYFWRDYLGNSKSVIAGSCPLWVASWGVEPAPFGPWENVSFWQYSASLTVPGVPAEVDGDYFFGTHHQLQEVLRAPVIHRTHP